MPAGQQYATNVPQTTLTGLINATATILSVASSSGWPATPFTAILDLGLSTQEPVDVTNITGTSWTVTRAIDGTVGMTHQVGATVTHGNIGRDFRDARTHIDASTGVHGIAGGSSVVGTTDTQTLSNKTIVTPLNFTGGGAIGLTSSSVIGTGSMQMASYNLTGLNGAATTATRLAGSSNVGGPPTTGTFATNDVVFDQVYQTTWLCTAGGTPGTWAPMGPGVLFVSNPVGSNFTMSGIPQGFRHLRLEYVARTSNAGGGGVDNIFMQFNGISTNTYASNNVFLNNGGAVSANTLTAQSSMICGVVWSSHFATTGSGRGWVEIPNYKENTFFKGIQFGAYAGDATNTSTSMTGGGSNSATTAITSITINTLSGNFLTGSQFVLYGIP